MTNLNKGRFKVADEAQAVWNFFALQNETYPEIIRAFIRDVHPEVTQWFDDCANDLHKARLIHGSIYDEHGRIEDKDVAQELHNHYVKWGYMIENFGGQLQKMLESGEIQGTIFY